jgi:hypothetical protein
MTLFDGGKKITNRWWKENENNMKDVAAMAKQYLAIQAPSASSERMLS